MHFFYKEKTTKGTSTEKTKLTANKTLLYGQFFKKVPEEIELTDYGVIDNTITIYQLILPHLDFSSANALASTNKQWNRIILDSNWSFTGNFVHKINGENIKTESFVDPSCQGIYAKYQGPYSAIKNKMREDHHEIQNILQLETEAIQIQKRMKQNYDSNERLERISDPVYNIEASCCCTGLGLFCSSLLFSIYHLGPKWGANYYYNAAIGFGACSLIPAIFTIWYSGNLVVRCCNDVLDEAKHAHIQDEIEEKTKGLKIQ